MADDDIEGPPTTVNRNRLIGRTIAGKYVIERFLGDGSMGAVYLARQTALDKHVALKLMHPRLTAAEEFVQRFRREAKAASRLDHPNSVRMFDFGEEPDGLLYLAMEYLEGRSLFDVIYQDWPLSPARIVDVLSQVLSALVVAHEMGVIHRDLKPENIMVVDATNEEGQTVDLVKVLDFGIAKLMDSPQRSLVDASELPRPAPGRALTTHGVLVGTPEYMSPEQAQGEKLDPRSDLYSVGVILYQLLVGRVPFEAESPIGIVVKQVSEQPKPPRVHFAGVDPNLESVCMKALQKNRDDRQQSARELRSELRAALSGRPSMPNATASEPGRTSNVPVSVSTVPLAFQPVPLATAPTVPGGSLGAPPRPLLVRPTPSKVTPIGTETTGSTAAKREGARWKWPSAIAALVALSGAGAVVGLRGFTHKAQPRDPLTSGASSAAESAVLPLDTRKTTVAQTDPPPRHDDPVVENTNAMPATVSPRAAAPTVRAPPRSRLNGLPDRPVVTTDAPPQIVHVAEPLSPTQSAAVVAPLPTVAPTVVVVPSPPPFDPRTCHARTSAPSTDGTVLVKDVNVGGFGAAAEACYQTALHGAPWGGNGKIIVSFDDTAHFKGASAAIASALPTLGACLEQAAQKNVNVRVRSGDITGEPQITIQLSFSCN